MYFASGLDHNGQTPTSLVAVLLWRTAAGWWAEATVEIEQKLARLRDWRASRTTSRRSCMGSLQVMVDRTRLLLLV